MVAELPKAIERGALSTTRCCLARLAGFSSLERELCFSCSSQCAEHGGEAVALFGSCEG